MCTLILLRRPAHDWPLMVAANRDEMIGRPWSPPGRHWPDRPEVVAGRDDLAQGSWLGVNDHGLLAAVLNRPGSLGPEAGLRSRGELVLEALDHASAADAVAALADLDGRAYRSFNLVVADRDDAIWLYGLGGDVGAITSAALGEGISMLTAHGLNDPASARVRAYLPRFRGAAAPMPENWGEWPALLASRAYESDAGPEGAMCIATETGFGTVSSSLIALDRDGASRWLFAPGPPDRSAFAPVAP